MILIGYDGSEDARSAIAQAATLMPGHPALVLTVWMAAEVDGGRPEGPGEDPAEAEAVAAEGAQLGHRFGVDCAPRTRCHRGTVADAILEEAQRVDARAIVVGRGRDGEPAPDQPGSIASTLLHRAPCAVLVAGPAGELAKVPAVGNSARQAAAHAPPQAWTGPIGPDAS